MQIGLDIKNSTSARAITAISMADLGSIPNTIDKPEELPFGLVNFAVTVANNGDTVKVTTYLSEAAPAGSKWFKYDSSNGQWSDYSEHAVFSDDMRSIQIELKDGGFGDADGVENGIIVDPSGIGIMSNNSQAANISGGRSKIIGVAGCFIGSSATQIPNVFLMILLGLCWVGFILIRYILKPMI